MISFKSFVVFLERITSAAVYARRTTRPDHEGRPLEVRADWRGLEVRWWTGGVVDRYRFDGVRDPAEVMTKTDHYAVILPWGWV